MVQRIREAEKLEVTVLVDNYCDLFLQDSDLVKRLRVLPPKAPLAEPGLSYLIKVYADTEEHTVLFDAGISATCLLHNAEALASSMAVIAGKIGTKLEDAEAVVLSHGHFDHFGGLMGFLRKAKQGLPIILHPEAFVQRRLKVLPDFSIDMPGLDETALIKTGAVIRKIKEASTLASDSILITGEVERVTGFEKGMPKMEAKIDDEWIEDPFHDDQGIAVKIKDRGIVVISGCSHAGIINTVKYVQKIAEAEKVHAVLGGFHLAGDNEQIIGPTVEAMKIIDPDYVIPMHCTGWKAINQFAAEMPEQFMLNNVGSTYIFGSSPKESVDDKDSRVQGF